MALLVLLMGSPASSVDAAAEIVESLGFRSQMFPDITDALQPKAIITADIAIISDNDTELQLVEHLQALKKIRPALECIVLTSPENIHHREADLGRTICGAGQQPPDRRELELLLRIASERIQLKRRSIIEKRGIARRVKNRFDRRHPRHPPTAQRPRHHPAAVPAAF